MRAENAHAYVNAGFRFNLLKAQNGKIVSKPTIVFGGINPTFVSISIKSLKINKLSFLNYSSMVYQPC